MTRDIYAAGYGQRGVVGATGKPGETGPGADVTGAQIAAARDAAVAAKTAAESARAGAEAVGTTNDAVIAGRINTPGSATATALAASFGDVTGALATFRAALAAHGAVRVVGLGSSTTAGEGFGITSPVRYINRLAAHLQAAFPSPTGQELPVLSLADGAAAPSGKAGVQVFNGGIGGAVASNYLTAGGALPYIDVLNPSLLIHMVGSNDRVAGTPPATYKANMIAALDQIDAVIAAPHVHLLVQTFPRPDVPNSTYPWADYGKALREIALERPATVAFYDIGADYVPLGVPGSDPTHLIGPDGIHQTIRGYEFMADRIATLLSLGARAKAQYLVYDDFKRVNGSAPSLNYATTGQAWVPSAGASFVVTGDQASVTAGGSVLIDAAASDVDVTCSLKYGGQTEGVLLRCSEDNTNRFGLFLSADGNVSIFRVDNGATTAVAVASYSASVGTTYLLRLKAFGGTVTGYINGSQVLTYTLTGPEQTKFGAFTRVGIRSGVVSAVRWDDFTVIPAVA